ncbi:MAG: hypothetical protein PIR02_15885 [Microbacterium enclense]
MNALALIFTPERRQAIQLFAGALAPLAILLGFGTAGVWEQALIIVGAALQFLSAVLSLVNVRKGDIGAGWAIIRAAIYTLAATVSPALVLLGFYDDETNATVLLGLSLALGALSNLLAIFIGAKQQLTVQLEQATDGTWKLPDPSTTTREEYQAALDPHNPANFPNPGAHNH